jgi:hypothetical protein
VSNAQEVVRRPGGLTVSVDTLPQMGVRMMQMISADKRDLARAAKLLDCGSHSFVHESYPSYMMRRWKPGAPPQPLRRTGLALCMRNQPVVRQLCGSTHRRAGKMD